MSVPQVLIVEDEAICAGFIENTLAERGYATVLADDGAEAWRLLENEPGRFQAILLDRNLPNLDGLSLLRQLKAMPAFGDTPVIMETAADDDASIREGLDAGAYYYLIKPLQRDLLVTIVAEAIAQHRDNLSIQEAVRQAEQSLCHLDQGVFHYRTLNEARNLAKVLAQTCPNPSKVIVGLQELLINAVEHGNLGISYAEKTRLMMDNCWLEEVERRQALPEYRDYQVEIRFERGPDVIRLIIKDQGEGFDWRNYLELDPQRAFDPHGRGIAMARMLSFDTLIYHGNGNTVEVSVVVPP